MNGEDVMKKKNKIRYGKVNLLPEKIEPKDEKIRISIMMEGDLLDALKTRAQELGRPYQTLMKEVLRQNLKLKTLGLFDFEMLTKKVHEIDSKLDLVLETEEQILAKRA